MLFSCIACSNQVIYRPIKEKAVSQEIISKNKQKLKIDAVLYDYNSDGMYDWYKALLFSSDIHGNWKQESISNKPITNINTSIEPYDAERIELCDKIQQPQVGGYIALEDSIEYFEDFSQLSYSIHFTDTTVTDYSEYDKINTAWVNISDTEAEINAYFNQNPDEATDMRMVSSFYFPEETTTYSYKDMELSINEIITGNFMDISLGAFTARILSRIEIYDINNKLVKAEDINQRRLFSVDVTNLPNDTYKVLIKLIDGDYWSDEGINILIAR